jgi:hypothetical protein
MSTKLPRNQKLLTVLCAASAGVHAALAPMHFQDGIELGLGFAAAAVLLMSVSVALDRRPQSQPAKHAAALVLGVLLVAYLATRISAVPLLGEHREPVEPVGVVTKLIEAFGLALAIKSTNQ